MEKQRPIKEDYEATVEKCKQILDSVSNTN